MEINTGWQISGTAAELYEENNVPTIFTAWARDLLERAQLKEGDCVLDVACCGGVCVFWPAPNSESTATLGELL